MIEELQKLGAPAEVIAMAKQQRNPNPTVGVFAENVPALNWAVHIQQCNFLRWTEMGHLLGLDTVALQADRALAQDPIEPADYKRLLTIMSAFTNAVNRKK